MPSVIATLFFFCALAIGWSVAMLGYSLAPEANMATIGYGDIHPVGQLSRVLVMVAVLFQFVFVTTLISTITRRLRLRDTDEP